MSRNQKDINHPSPLHFGLLRQLADTSRQDAVAGREHREHQSSSDPSEKERRDFTGRINRNTPWQAEKISSFSSRRNEMKTEEESLIYQWRCVSFDFENIFI